MDTATMPPKNGMNRTLCKIVAFRCVQPVTDVWKLGFGGAREDRTPGLYIANVALSQLSYDPTVDDAHRRWIDSNHRVKLQLARRLNQGDSPQVQAALCVGDCFG
jgi:hypothetical protein